MIYPSTRGGHMDHKMNYVFGKFSCYNRIIQKHKKSKEKLKHKFCVWNPILDLQSEPSLQMSGK